MIADLTILNIISFLLIFFIGLPHGSFDGAVASLVGFSNRFQFIQFLFYYLTLFLLVIIFWLYFPIVALTIFINFKINKFKYSVSFTYGMTIIFGIIFFNENQSFLIFEYLTNDKIYSFQKYFLIPYLVTLLSIIYFTYLSFIEKKLRKGVIEIIFLLSIFYFFDPLLSFAIYFCFFHTFYHNFLDWWFRNCLLFSSKYITIRINIKSNFYWTSRINTSPYVTCRSYL